MAKEKHSMEKRPGSSGPNDLISVVEKAPLEAPVPVSEEFKPEGTGENYKYTPTSKK